MMHACTHAGTRIHARTHAHSGNRYEAMTETSWVAVLYFVVTQFIGVYGYTHTRTHTHTHTQGHLDSWYGPSGDCRYLLLSLFVAVLTDGFSVDVDLHEDQQKDLVPKLPFCAVESLGCLAKTRLEPDESNHTAAAPPHTHHVQV